MIAQHKDHVCKEWKPRLPTFMDLFKHISNHYTKKRRRRNKRSNGQGYSGLTSWGERSRNCWSKISLYLSKWSLRQEGETSDVLLALHGASASDCHGRWSPASKEFNTSLTGICISLKYICANSNSLQNTKNFPSKILHCHVIWTNNATYFWIYFVLKCGIF